jgi:sugar lactone lactonase YvrE
LLANHPSTKYEPGGEMVVDGIKLIDPKTGKAPAMNVDGIALDADDGWLYYHALNGHTLYRIKTACLCDEALSAAKLEEKVEKLATTPKPDGMLEAGGAVYLTAVEQDAILRFDIRSRKTTTLVEDKRLQWPDTLAWGLHHELYVTCSQIHRMSKYHRGQSEQQGPFAIYRIKAEAAN